MVPAQLVDVRSVEDVAVEEEEMEEALVVAVEVAEAVEDQWMMDRQLKLLVSL